MSYYLHMTDDGPAAAGGQDVLSTMPSNNLMKFPDEDSARHFVRMVNQYGNGRKNPRFTGWDESEILEM